MMRPEVQAQLTEYLTDYMTAERRALMDTVLAERTDHVTVVLENTTKPHNSNAVVRTSECFGIQTVHVIDSDRDYFVRRHIARGSANWVDIAQYDDPEADNTTECLEALKVDGYQIVATSLEPGSRPISELPVDQKIALCFGSEDPGLSPQALGLADERVYVPMLGMTQSLNLSVTVGICLYELTAKLRTTGVAWQLPTAKQQHLRLLWTMRNVRRSDLMAARWLKENGLSIEGLDAYIDEDD